MTRIDYSDGCDMHCFRSDHRLIREVNNARAAADAKHDADSIQQIAAHDPRWLSILVEEVGEVANALTYDTGRHLRDELIDVLAVASAWVDALRVAEPDCPHLGAADPDCYCEATP